MRVRQLRVGDWVVTSMWHTVAPQGPSRVLQGLLVGLIRRPGNDDGPLAYVLVSHIPGVRVFKASHVIQRIPL